MDINSYPNLNKMKVVHRTNLNGHEIHIGAIEVSGTYYRAVYNASLDILRGYSSSTKFLCTPVKVMEGDKYIVLLNPKSNLLLTIDVDNNVKSFKVLKGTEHGIHLTKRH